MCVLCSCEIRLRLKGFKVNFANSTLQVSEIYELKFKSVGFTAQEISLTASGAYLLNDNKTTSVKRHAYIH